MASCGLSVRFRKIFDDFLRILVVAPPRLRQRDGTRGAQREPGADLRLKFSHGSGDGRRGDAEPSGGGGETGFLRDGGEDRESAKPIHYFTF